MLGEDHASRPEMPVVIANLSVTAQSGRAPVLGGHARVPDTGGATAVGDAQGPAVVIHDKGVAAAADEHRLDGDDQPGRSGRPCPTRPSFGTDVSSGMLWPTP
jgi:hypothetical protein